MKAYKLSDGTKFITDYPDQVPSDDNVSFETNFYKESSQRINAAFEAILGGEFEEIEIKNILGFGRKEDGEKEWLIRNYYSDSRHTVKLEDLIQLGWDFTNRFAGTNEEIAKQHGNTEVSIYIRYNPRKGLLRETLYELDGDEELWHTGDTEQTIDDINTLTGRGLVLNSEDC